MLTYFGGACVMFWLWRLTRHWDRDTNRRALREVQQDCPLPVRGPQLPLSVIPFGKPLDIPPVIRP